MSKKKFTAGLDSLFSNRSEPVGLEALTPRKSPSRRAAVSMDWDDDVAVTDPQPSKRINHKTFASDLAAFLEDVLADVPEQQDIPLTAEQLHDDPGRTNAPTGLDALIRDTLDTSEMVVTSGKTKRVTFFFDERKIELLKSIAKSENVYMREIISRIVAEYLARYDQSKY